MSWWRCFGPSGCGKTTALRALSGLEDIDSGSIHAGGEDVTTKPANQRDMAMVFQAYSLFPHMTVAANIAFALELRKIAGDRRKAVAENLELVGLTAQADRYPHQLSGGQQQRVALARALAVQAAGAVAGRTAVRARRQGPRPNSAKRSVGCSARSGIIDRLRHR